MRRFIESLWGQSSTVGMEGTATESGCFYGVAIGPESDEAFVYVNGILLQAGRVLPLRADSYQLQRFTMRTDGSTKPASIKRLELMLFEHPSELTVNVARPTKMIRNEWADPGPATEINLGPFPFSGRRHGTFHVMGTLANGITRYRVEGHTHDNNTIEIADEAGVWTSLAIHVGGTDHAEQFEQITIAITTDTSGVVLAMLSGEIGCP